MPTTSAHAPVVYRGERHGDPNHHIHRQRGSHDLRAGYPIPLAPEAI